MRISRDDIFHRFIDTWRLSTIYIERETLFKDFQFDVRRVRELVDHLRNGIVLSKIAEDGLRPALEGIRFVIDRVYWRTFGDSGEEDRGRNEAYTCAWYRCVHYILTG